MRTASTPKWLAETVNWIVYTVGSLFFTLSVDIFTVPNQLVPGGVTGIATMLNHLFPMFPVGLGIVLINLPLLIAAWFCLGRGFTLRTAGVTVISSLLIDTLAPLLPAYRGDRLLAALFGGVLAGVGLALIYLRGATSGGSEIAARLIEKNHPHLSIGRLLLLVDGIIVTLSAFVYHEAESAMYGATLIVITSLVMDELIGGTRRARTVWIVSSPDTDLPKTIAAEMSRGVTVLRATGSYTGTDRLVLMCAVRPSEVFPLQNLVRREDPSAFIIVADNDQVIGNGFQTM